MAADLSCIPTEYDYNFIQFTQFILQKYFYLVHVYDTVLKRSLKSWKYHLISCNFPAFNIVIVNTFKLCSALKYLISNIFFPNSILQLQIVVIVMEIHCPIHCCWKVNKIIKTQYKCPQFMLMAEKSFVYCILNYVPQYLLRVQLQLYLFY